MRTSASRFRVEVARDVAQAERHLESWRQLDAAALDDNFYSSPDFMLPALRWLVPGEDARIAFVYENGPARRLVACAPFQLLSGVDGLPLPTLANLLTPHGYVGTPLVHRDCAAEAVGALMDWLDRPERPWQLVCWRRMAMASATWRLLEQEMCRRGRKPLLRAAFDRPAMVRAGSFESYLASLSSSRRRTYRRGRERLEELGCLEVRVHRDLSEVTDLAGHFMALEGQGWKGESGTALRSAAPDRGFFTEVVERAGAERRLLFVELRLDGRPVAMHARFVAGSTVFAFKLGYDEQLEKCAPGIVADVECARVFFESGLRHADSGTSGPGWASPYWNDTAPIGELVVATPGVLSRAVLKVFPLARELKRGATRQAERARERLLGARRAA